MNEKTWLIIYVVIGWLTAIVIELQCNRWKNKHAEAITAWIIESNNKDKQILKLQEELENLKAKPEKHGQWILRSRQITDVTVKLPTECNNCDFSEYNAERYNFCPNCGADMRGNADEQP